MGKELRSFLKYLILIYIVMLVATFFGSFHWFVLAAIVMVVLEEAYFYLRERIVAYRIKKGKWHYKKEIDEE